MLLGGDVAEHARAVPAGQGRADGRGDVVVARRDVGHQRAEHVEGGLVALDRLLLHVHGDLVHRQVAGTFDHHLAAARPGPSGQLAQRLQLGELRRVGGVGDRAGAQAVAEAPGHVVLPHDVAEVVEPRVDRVLGVVRHHPLRHQRAAPRDDPRHPVRRQADVIAEDAGVERHVIDALPGLVLDHVEEVLLGQVLDLLDLLDRLIDRHGADRHGAGGQDGPADRVDLAAGGQVHHRVGAQVDGHLELGQLVVDLRGDGRIADIGIDLAPGLDADPHRLQAHRQVDAIGRDDHPPPRDLGADQLGGERLAPGDVLHLGGDDAEPRLFDLSHDASNLREPVVSVEVHRLARPRTRPGRSSRSILDRRDGFGQFNRRNRRRGARGAVTSRVARLGDRFLLRFGAKRIDESGPVGDINRYLPIRSSLHV